MKSEEWTVCTCIKMCACVGPRILQTNSSVSYYALFSLHRLHGHFGQGRAKRGNYISIYPGDENRHYQGMRQQSQRLSNDRSFVILMLSHKTDPMIPLPRIIMVMLHEHLDDCVTQVATSIRRLLRSPVGTAAIRGKSGYVTETGISGCTTCASA